MSRDVKKDMLDYLPRYYTDSPTVTSLIDAEAKEIRELNNDITDVLNQFFVNSATWGLDRWESICGIQTDKRKPLDQRRSVIISKMRGIGTVTVSFIKSVAMSYESGELDVTEYHKNKLPDFSHWVKHSNAKIYSTDNYQLDLNATNRGESSYYDITLVNGWTYTLWSKGGKFQINEVTKSGEFVKVIGVADGSEALTFTCSLTEKTNKYRVMTVNESSGSFFFVKPQLERGNVATSFEPRKEYTIGITFISNIGIPPNLNDIKEALRSIIPAHLNLDFNFRYLLINDVHNVMTLSKLETQLLSNFGGA